MKVIDKDAPSDIDKFWIAMGEMRVKAAIKGNSDEVIVEEKQAVCDALQAPDATEAGRAAFQRGVDRSLDQLIAADAWAVKNEPGYVSFVKSVLGAYVASIPAGKCTVRPERRTLKRKTVESFDAEGRILAMIEEDVEV